MGLPSGTFLSSQNTAMATLIGLGIFGLGGGCILFLASLKNIPESLYESANIEGASWFAQTFKITIPMCTPVIFYGLISGIIASLQTFGTVFILTAGRPGPNNSLFFYVFNIYSQAFSSFRMGYASALSWMLFFIIGILTFIIFKTSKWVFYGEDS
jgi:multiple sugar transport system permease protein